MDTKKRFEQLESVMVDLLTKQDELSLKQDVMLGHIGLLVEEVSKINHIEKNIEIIAEKVSNIDRIERTLKSSSITYAGTLMSSSSHISYLT